MSVTDITELYNYHKQRQGIGLSLIHISAFLRTVFLIPLRAFVGYPAPVSYTHLDVYKRQVLIPKVTEANPATDVLHFGTQFFFAAPLRSLGQNAIQFRKRLPFFKMCIRDRFKVPPPSSRMLSICSCPSCSISCGRST